MILITKWFGVFLVDEKTNRIADKRLMPMDAMAAAEKLAIVQKGGILPEERELAKDIPRLNVLDRRQSELGKPMLFDAAFIKPESFGFGPEMMRKVMMNLGRLRTSEPLARDINLVQAIRYLDDTIATANLLNERLHEWYGMHFPELADYAKDRHYAGLIARNGNREDVLEELGLEIESMGAEFDDEDMYAVMELADTLAKIYEDKERIERYINGMVQGICPNMCALLGGPLSARMISLAGGLTRLSTLPSSTVQLLGAEKAMFRHLKSGKNPPKHGVIYQHPDVHRSPYWQRGKIARVLAGKVSIAAKVDAYDGEYRGDVLASEFKARVAEIKKKYPDPPKKKNQPQGKPRRRGKGPSGSGKKVR